MLPGKDHNRVVPSSETVAKLIASRGWAGRNDTLKHRSLCPRRLRRFESPSDSHAATKDATRAFFCFLDIIMTIHQPINKNRR